MSKKTEVKKEAGPIIRAVGMVKMPDKNEYCTVILTVQDGQVIDSEFGEPNMKIITRDELKIAVIREFFSNDII